MTSVKRDQKEALYKMARKVSNTLGEQGHIRQDWSAMGYNGYGQDRLKYGERGEDEAILILSGPLAQEHFHRPKIDPSRVTRCDVQVTVMLSPRDPLMASRTHRHLEAIFRSKKKRPVIGLVSSITGDTLYVGRRGATIMLRFYDKSDAMGEEELGVIWRYEVQYRQKAAKAAAKLLVNDSSPLEVVIGLVASEFMKRSVDPGISSNSTVNAIQVGRSITTPEGQIQWLERCVAPVIQQLCLLGYEEDVFNTLNLRALMKTIQERKEWQ
jgi:DNA relaxase NicK